MFRYSSSITLETDTTRKEMGERQSEYAELIILDGFVVRAEAVGEIADRGAPVRKSRIKLT